MFDLNRALIAKLCWNVASGVDRGSEGKVPGKYFLSSCLWGFYFIMVLERYVKGEKSAREVIMFPSEVDPLGCGTTRGYPIYPSFGPILDQGWPSHITKVADLIDPVANTCRFFGTYFMIIVHKSSTGAPAALTCRGG